MLILVEKSGHIFNKNVRSVMMNSLGSLKISTFKVSKHDNNMIKAPTQHTQSQTHIYIYALGRNEPLRLPDT